MVTYRSKKTKLLSTPETETDSVLDAELGELNGNVENTDSTRTIIAKHLLVKNK